MAFGRGSKKSVSCDQTVIHASLNNGVSNVNTYHTIRSEQLLNEIIVEQNVLYVDVFHDGFLVDCLTGH